MEKIAYINADALIEELMEDEQEAHSTQWFVEKLLGCRAENVEEIVWTDFLIEWGGFATRHVKCGNCESRFTERTDFPYNRCPNCGARRKHHD